jgi:hypothetical protein
MIGPWHDTGSFRAMTRKHGNPNWGHSIAAAPALATAFELQVVQLQADQVTYTARGFRNKQNFINAIYFHCGGGWISILGPLNSRKRHFFTNREQVTPSCFVAPKS